MAVDYTYQNTATLSRIAQDLVLARTMDDPIFNIFPIRRRMASKLRWQIRDNYVGLMKLRGLGGEPTRVERVGENVYEARPGVYGEFMTVDEAMMTERAAGIPANMDVPISIADLIAENQEQLITREVNRVRQITWTLAMTGTFAIPLPGGGIGHSETYTPQTVTVSPLWSSNATATPLRDLGNLQADFGRGTSNSFMGTAQAWMNSVTAAHLLANSNDDDLGGKSVDAAGNSVDNVADVNRFMLRRSLPQINIFDDGYLDDSGTFQMFVPDGKVLVVGARPDGETPGEFQMTLNAVTGAPGEYTEVLDYRSGPARKIPPTIEVHCGWNGGPTVQRATQLIVMTVA